MGNVIQRVLIQYSTYLHTMAHSGVHSVAGVQVHFGRQPFGPQFALMSKIIPAIRSSVNALLESPTGTGKTLALLAGGLAAQHAFRQQLEASKATNAVFRHMDTLSNKLARVAAESEAMKSETAGDAAAIAAAVPRPHVAAPDPIAPGAVLEVPVPVIYFFSRTHSQLSQVIREYGKLHAYTQPGGAALAGPGRELLRETVAHALSGPVGVRIAAALAQLQPPEGATPTDLLLPLAELAAAPRLPPPVMTLLASRSRTCVDDDALAGDLSRLYVDDATGAAKKRRSGGGAAAPASAAPLTACSVDDACSALLAARACKCGKRWAIIAAYNSASKALPPPTPHPPSPSPTPTPLLLLLPPAGSPTEATTSLTTSQWSGTRT